MHIYLFFFSNQTRLQVVRTVLPNCVRFDVVPRLLIGAQRSIELQASGVGPFHPSFRHSPTRSVVSFPLYPLLGLVPSTYSFLCFLPFCYALYIYIYILPSRSVAVARAALSEFHFRPITIHPHFKAAVHAALIFAARLRRKRIISFLRPRDFSTNDAAQESTRPGSSPRRSVYRPG